MWSSSSARISALSRSTNKSPLAVSLRFRRVQHGSEMIRATTTVERKICSTRKQTYSSSTIFRMGSSPLQKPPMPRVLPGTSITSSTTTKSASSTTIFGRPPMPRVLPGITTSTTAAATVAVSAETQSSSLKKARPPGSTLITFGWLLLGLVAVDQYLQYSEKQEANRLIAKLKNEEIEQRKRLLDEWKDAPALHETIVHMKYKMGGTNGLRGVVVNDHLEVLQENVGPGKTYCLCRKRTPQQNSSDSEEIIDIGWYPTSFMTKIESKQTKAKKFWFF